MEGKESEQLLLVHIWSDFSLVALTHAPSLCASPGDHQLWNITGLPSSQMKDELLSGPAKFGRYAPKK